MIWGIVCLAMLPCLGLLAWCVILPPRERDGYEDFELQNLREGVDHE